MIMVGPRLTALTQKAAAASELVETTGAIASCLADQALLADLIVVNRKLDDFPYPDMRGAAAETLIQAGKPILAVPDASRGVNVSGKVLVCWDGSPACTEAVQAAIPLLKLAEKVDMLVVDDGSIALPAEEGAAYLSRHGIHAMIHQVAAHSRKPAAVILDAIRHYTSDYVVMGGFSHSRLTEALLGGVTRAMLTESPVPVFLAH